MSTLANQIASFVEEHVSSGRRWSQRSEVPRVEFSTGHASPQAMKRRTSPTELSNNEGREKEDEL